MENSGSLFQSRPSPTRSSPRWKVIIVDDEPEVHELTKLVLRNLKFQDRKLELLSAYSGDEAKTLCGEHGDAALVLMDVVMETEDAGLRAVRYIREELKNYNIRIILRTGHAGGVPEKKVITEYDINDYKEKAELTTTKLFTTIITSLRSFKEIQDRQLAEKMLMEGRKKLHRHNEILVQLTQHKMQSMGNLDAALKKISETAAQTLKIDCVSIWLLTPENNHFHLRSRYYVKDQSYTYGDNWTPEDLDAYLHSFDEIRTQIVEDTEALETASSGPDYASESTRSTLDVPLRFRQDTIGVVRYEQFDEPREWTKEEENFATSMTDFVALAISSLKHEEQIRQNTRMESELKTAAAVQFALLPRSLPVTYGLEFASYFQSASETGGDWYGFLTSFEQHLYILIGDATGHGTPAALITATACATSRTLEEMYCAQNEVPSPAQLLEHLNKAVFDTGYPDFLMTFFIAQIDLKTGGVIFSNAAHNFPLIIHPDGKVKSLLSRNALLGFQHPQSFTNNKTQLSKGDTLFFYTDGLIENTNADSEMWGYSRLKQILKKNPALSLDALVEQIAKESEDFYGETPIADDTTIVACRVTEAF